MRTYAPAGTRAVLEQLLEEPSLARGVSTTRSSPRARRARRLARVAGPADPGRARRTRHRAAVHPPGGGDRGRPRAARTSSSSRPRRRASRCATRCPVLQALAEDPSARALFLFPTKALGQDQVAEFGELVQDAGLDGRRRVLRRRHAGADPVGDPQGRAGRGHQPGHAPLGDPPPPHQVVPAVRAAAGHRHRRAAHVPGRVRVARRERAPPAAPAVRPLRLEPGDRVLLGDDREPGRARGDADRPAGPADRPQRRAGGREAPAAGRPAGASTRRPGARGSALTLAQRWALPFLRAGRQTVVFGKSRVAVEIMLSNLRETLRMDLGPRNADPRLPRRLPADRAAVDRARAARRRGAGRRVHERPRARASTSGGWTSRSSRATRARSPGPGSRWAGPAGAATSASRSSSPRRRRSTSTSSTTRSSCSAAGPRRRGSTRTTSTSCWPTSGARDVRAAVRARRVVRARAGGRPARVPRRGRARPPGRRRPLVLELGELPGVGGVAAGGRARERRDHRHHAGPAAGPRRGRPVQRPGARPPARDLHARVGAVPRGPARLGRAQGVRPPDRRGPLHVRQPGGDAQAARRVRRGAGDRRARASTAR